MPLSDTGISTILHAYYMNIIANILQHLKKKWPFGLLRNKFILNPFFKIKNSRFPGNFSVPHSTSIITFLYLMYDIRSYVRYEPTAGTAQVK